MNIPDFNQISEDSSCMSVRFHVNFFEWQADPFSNIENSLKLSFGCYSNGRNVNCVCCFESKE